MNYDRELGILEYLHPTGLSILAYIQDDGSDNDGDVVWVICLDEDDSVWDRVWNDGIPFDGMAMDGLLWFDTGNYEMTDVIQVANDLLVSYGRAK